MTGLEWLFFGCVFTLLFVYGMYGPIMLLLKKLKNGTFTPKVASMNELPTISLIVPAFNEEHWIKNKIQNSLDLIYPKDRFEVIVVTDGSTDNSNEYASEFGDQILLLHQSARNGKIKAMDRAAQIANNEILVFTDANTILNDLALKEIAQNFKLSEVGMVAGEKKVRAMDQGEAASGEGLYWKYESWLKKLDSEVASVIGAAGELFAIRADLYDSLPADTILDDFMLSSRVIELGYKVAYEPNAYAIEYGSASYKDEWKRKVRICTGGVQSVIRSFRLFDFAKYGIKSFSFMVHRAARWTVAPLALLVSYVISGMLFYHSDFYSIYFLIGSFAITTTILSIITNQKNLPKPILLVVYFTFMHLSAIAGWFRFVRNKQHVNWERSARLG